MAKLVLILLLVTFCVGGLTQEGPDFIDDIQGNVVYTILGLIESFNLPAEYKASTDRIVDDVKSGITKCRPYSHNTHLLFDCIITVQNNATAQLAALYTEVRPINM